MRTTCGCTLSRLLTEEESGRVELLARANGGNRVAGSVLAKIDRFSGRQGCPYLHRFDEETGFCSCQEFLEDWSLELGETAGLMNGRRL